ncbi:MAG: phosphoglucomutase [Candidatus Adiutrix intracellularis]|jgi:phosphoglucomutase|nr:MAG: phosphoglucomutase [Candidatus Adiutrix intracellularis]MDR2827376.1 phosphoglucomutase, alpha-D-glucose phosphate-specific [Candidatus Adiutrix intracellularis]
MVHPLAGQKAPTDQLVNLPRLLADYYTIDPATPIAFGTSGHRGSALVGSFNENHVAAITAATAEYRQRRQHTGPLFLGFDTHALSEAAFRTTLEVLAAYGVPTIIHKKNEYTPTPVISHLIINHNLHHPKALSDGLIITPSHNPPTDGGLKYNPPHGGPADVDVTNWIEKRANELLSKPTTINRWSYLRARSAETTQEADFIRPFVRALNDVVDLPAIKSAGLKLAADPLGGSGINFWGPIAEEWGLNLQIVNPIVDASFAFMTLDSDGAIRMDCSSPYAMAGLIQKSGGFDLAFGNDPDFDRHGIVSGGKLMNPNHFLAVAIDYLLSHRPHWPNRAKVGKTLVSSGLIDQVVATKGRELYETPVGFKWFVEGLTQRSLVFGGEESAGASLLQRNGSTWTTDKDGFALTLLAAEIMARIGRAPHELYEILATRHGHSHYGRLDTAITESEKTTLKSIDAARLVGTICAGRKIIAASTVAAGNNAPIGGLKVILADRSWFAFRPSGTEPKLKFYVESFSSPEDWRNIVAEAPGLIFN